MTEKDYRKEGEEMEKKKKKKYSRTDRVILGIGFTILGLFVLSIAIPIIYVVLASFMDPTVLNNQGLSFNIKDWTLDAYRRVLENEMIWRGFLNSFLYSLAFTVMKESVQIALTLVKSLYPKESKVFQDHDLHIHVPEGAVPKDGPSAGITLTTALASLVTGKAVSPDYAMTGEVSLRGGILPIGGLPEKLMAAQRAGITKILIPFDNADDLEDVAAEVKDKLKITPVKKVSDVLKLLLG